MNAKYRGPALNRRDFVKVIAASSAGLVLGGVAVYTPTAQAADATPTPLPAEDEVVFAPNVYLKIEPSGAITITVHRSEMGQGTRTALAMLMVEELDADLRRVRIEQADGDRSYGDQLTGGSQSISSWALIYQAMGARARQMLTLAAAQAWGVEPAECSTAESYVIHPDGIQRYAYGDLVPSAALIDPKSLPRIERQPAEEYTLVGTRMGQWDGLEMVTGKAIYGLDVKVSGMYYAALARCPAFGGKFVSMDDGAARAIPGVMDVVQIDQNVAVVAEDTWAALRGRRALHVEWDMGKNATATSESIRASLLSRAPEAGGPGMLEAVYEIPYQAHCAMEPMNSVAAVRAEGCEVWSPTQTPQEVRAHVTSAVKLPADEVQVHVPLIGGGFGRRLQTDYGVEAAKVSQAVGVPVQVVWTRDDDIRHDFYHPMSVTFASVSLEQPMQRPSIRTMSATSPLPTGAWRSVENFPDAWARESLIDEYAAATAQNPYALRLALCGSVYPSAAQAPLELAAEKAGWGEPLPKGQGRGIAYYAAFGVTHVAAVAEVAVDAEGNVHVLRVVYAVDCGKVVHPDAVEAQMEGGIVFGLTAALKAQITVKEGRVEQSNFDDCPLLTFDEMPAVEVYIVPSDRDPTGIGEMGVPPIAPAVANAIYAATGKRVRRLPIRPADLVEQGP